MKKYFILSMLMFLGLSMDASVTQMIMQVILVIIKISNMIQSRKRFNQRTLVILLSLQILGVIGSWS